MTKLQKAMHDFRSRSQFHDEPKLQEIISAVREEERAKVLALIEAAKAIVTSESTAVSSPSDDLREPSSEWLRANAQKHTYRAPP